MDNKIKNYNVELLDIIFNKYKNAKLIDNNYNKIRKDTLIKFICEDCNLEDNKGFKNIYDRGPYCKKCIIKKRLEKTKNTFQTKYGVPNMNHIPGMKERIKETKNTKYTKDKQNEFLIKCHEGSKKRWEEYRKKNIPFINSIITNGKAICKFCNTERDKDRFQSYISSYTDKKMYDLKCYDCKNEVRKEREEKKQLKCSLEEYFETLIKGTKERIKNNSKIKEATITVDDLKELWNKQAGKCFYSGREMKYNFSRKELPKLSTHPEKVSIDRVDSDKGYTKNNVVLCCSLVNFMKLDTKLDEFKKWIKDINNNMNDK
jgi:hypothetical protein